MSPTETSGSTKREIQVEIPAADVARETETLIQKYQKLARIPGFRTGHAPASIIKQRFAEGIKSDVVEALVPRYFRKETDKLGLMPVSQPRVSDLHVHDGEPLRFKASFEVMPTIRVEDYKEWGGQAGYFCYGRRSRAIAKKPTGAEGDVYGD